jgi:predicted MPP superfamily phosphohydrolase
MPATRKKWSRRKFIAGALVGTVGAFSYAKFLEPRWLAVRRNEVPLNTPGGVPIRLLHLSDFHASEQVSLDYIQRAVRRGLELKPDLVCLTGDFITWRYGAFERYAEILKSISDVAPAWAVLGNHDGGKWVGAAGYSDTRRVRELLSGARIELLHNRSTEVQIQGRRLVLAGVGDLWADELDASAAFAEPRSGSTTILLSHNPDSKELLRAHAWDLMLCGHTHGGQCDLVFFGTPFAPVRDKRYVRGLHRWNDRWIHITAGVGNLHGIRLNCRPEVNLLTLT